MTILFYTASAIAIISTLLVITRTNGVHALLYLIVSLLSVAVMFLTLGAPFIAALEVIVYAGAIMVLFIFVVMMLNLGKEAAWQEKKLLSPGMWIGPGLLALALFIELAYVLANKGIASFEYQYTSPTDVGLALFGPYLLAAEMAAMLLMAGIVGAYHIGRRKKTIIHRYLRENGEE